MKKKTKIIAIAVVMILAGVVFLHVRKGGNTMTWRTMPAQVRTITSSITATGTINPVIQVNVGTEVSGKIEKLYKDFNDRVKRGELIALLDTSDLQMALEDARIELRKIQLTANENLIDLNSAKELFDQNMIAQFELQKAQYTYDLSIENVEKAKFSVQRAERNLNNAKIFSPIDGVIISRTVDEGQTVAASLNAPTLFIIANNLEEMQIEAQIDEADIGKVKNDMRARFSIDAFPDQSFFGRVRQIRLNPIVEQNVVSYKVIISVSNPDRIIMPGMTASVEIIIDQKREVVAVSERALQFRPSKEIWEAFKLPWDESLVASSRPRQRQGGGGGRPEGGAGEGRPEGREGGRRGEQQVSTPQVQNVNIWILENGTPKQISVEPGITDGSFFEVVNGIEPDVEVIVGVNQGNATPAAAQSSAFGAGGGGGMRVMMR